MPTLGKPFYRKKRKCEIFQTNLGLRYMVSTNGRVWGEGWTRKGIRTAAARCKEIAASPKPLEARW